VIEVRDLTRRFGDTLAVDAVSFDVDRGEVLVLVGASGCGKTTTLKMLNRLVEPSAGCVRIDGCDTRELDAAVLRRRIGYGFQQVGLFPHWDVAENVAITPKLLGWSRARIDARVDALLEMVRLPPAEFRSRDPATLSGGQRQRVGLARALAAEPALLLLDEPFGALDPITRDHLQRELLDVRDRLDLCVVFSTHDMSEALLVGDRIAVLDAGRLVRVAPPRDLLADPGDARVERLLETPRRQMERIEALSR